MPAKYKCIYCKKTKTEEEFYVCKSRGVSHRKSACKICFNRSKHRNARRKKFIELTSDVKFNKYEKFKDKKEDFSSDLKGALREGDIYD